MNTPTIFIALFVTALLIGCNNELNLMDSYDYGRDPQSSKPENCNMQLLWKLDELCINASQEIIVENKAIYVNPPFMYIADYLITFDSYTDAGKHTNGYVPVLEVSKDNETVFEGADCPEANPEGICHRTLKLENVRFNNLTFYIALLQGDNPPASQSDVTCTLKLTNVQIFLLE